MSSVLGISKHDSIKAAIFAACNDLGFQAIQEYRGKDWRADVHVVSDAQHFAFEIQISPQSLKRTLERQDKYVRDGVLGCWLFEKPFSKSFSERPDLPLFYVSAKEENSFSVSLSDRKDLRLSEFLREFLIGKVKFCNVARTTPQQKVSLVFYELKCWKCAALNHLYYVAPTFRSACNAAIHAHEIMWGSNKIAHRPDIMALAREYIGTESGSYIRLGKIKRRFSKTVEHDYLSFGCFECDSIFGDWFVKDAEFEIASGHKQVSTIERSINIDENLELQIPHWCYPGELQFCDNS